MLKQKIFEAIRRCEQSLFIFDNMDKAPEKMIQFLSSILEHITNMGGNAFYRATFLLLSNSGANQIRETMDRLIDDDGITRDQLAMEHFEDILKVNAYTSTNNPNKLHLISPNLIDSYIPFLPLEIEHVEKCLDVLFYKGNRTIAPDDLT